MINYKGGVGKTTITANVGAELAWRGKRVLLLDMDPQSSLTFSFIRPETWEQEFQERSTIKAWFDSLSRDKRVPLPGLIHTPYRVNRSITSGRLDLIPSHLGLINVDLELAAGLGGASLAQARRSYLHVHNQLSTALRNEDFPEYDIALIDCPPNFNIVTKNAIVSSDAILVPAIPDYLSTMGIAYFQRSVAELVRDFNEFLTVGDEGDAAAIDPHILGVVCPGSSPAG